MGRKFFTCLWLSTFVCCVHAATTSTFDQDFIKQTLGKMLIDNPLKDFKGDAPDVTKTISIGFHSSQEIEYFPRVRKYKVPDQLMGYMAYLFANQDIRTLKELFYEPKRKEWNELGAKLAVNPLSSLGIMCFLDTGKKRLIEALGQQNISAYRVEFYIIPLIDQMLLQIYGGLWGETEKNIDEEKLLTLTGILKRTAFSQKAYGRPEYDIDALIQKSDQGYLHDFSSVFKKEWYDSYVKNSDILGTRGVRDELGHQLAKLTIGAVTQGLSISSAYIDCLIKKALNTPNFTVGAVERILVFMENLRLKLTQNQTGQLLYFVDELEAVERDFYESLYEAFIPSAMAKEVSKTCEDSPRPVKRSSLSARLHKLFSKKTGTSGVTKGKLSAPSTHSPPSIPSCAKDTLPVVSKNLRDQLTARIKALG
ncbi:hypothetical protein [Candidatus Finniella inopinata]|uniref:Uncharacterized protein n=1 Tax=Candidatus Finniella inopinata TaxID=1696036 RepID=A0A4Q7DGF7_9PROT|nr:hypothetical protein [Candidatus Finniella inopinata]RZI45139.1 hypothetical protein EQU50_08140 [Candidatus Finniella inopinata]